LNLFFFVKLDRLLFVINYSAYESLSVALVKKGFDFLKSVEVNKQFLKAFKLHVFVVILTLLQDSNSNSFDNE